MRKPMAFRFAFSFALLFVLIPVTGALAEKFESPENGFSIDPPAEWKKIPQNFQGGIVSYTREGSTALFHVTARDLEETKTVADLKWEDLFKPQFDSIAIGVEGEAVIGGKKAKYCVYRIKPGPFKAQMEGNIPAKYINYVMVNGSRLFSITFLDTLDNFNFNYVSFLAAARSVKFSEPKPVAQGAASEAVSSKSQAPGSSVENPPLDFKPPKEQ